ncbi:MAG: HEAT repeat domain-containing protein [Nitrospiraceae bacterium]
MPRRRAGPNWDPSAVMSMPLLQDKVKAVREQVTASLAAIGDSAVSPLLQALEHDEWLIRLHAVEALATEVCGCRCSAPCSTMGTPRSARMYGEICR